MDIFINDEQEEIKITDEKRILIEDAICEIFKEEALDDDFEISITFVDNNKIRELNNIYRGKNIETDVLSFPLCSKEELKEDSDIKRLLGDIIISTDMLLKQAEEYGNSIEREMIYLIIHGMFHLLGYDHIDENDARLMREKEKSIVRKIKIFRESMN